jgi:SPP1 family predicted phage head-tail adaptor
MMLNPAKMDRRIILQRRTVAQDAYGEEIETWSTLDTVWAQRVELKGSEQWQARQVIANIDAKYRIHWRDGLTPVDRMTENGRVFDVHSCVEMGRREALELIVSARAE